MPVFGKRRAYGQHFLRSPDIINRIVETTLTEAKEHGCAALLEIGPGKGALTDLLLEKWHLPFEICERDTALAREWTDRVAADRPLARVHTADFLELPPKAWLSRQPLAVVSNLPYSAGTAILTRLARHPESIPVMVLMFQAEVARRLRAEPSTKEWGSLSVWIQNRWDVRKLCAAPPGAFAPPPDVDSEVVVLTRRTEPRIAVPRTPETEERWESLLRVCFAHRRKMLRGGLPKDSPWSRALQLSGVDPTLRAEALSWEQWDALWQALNR